MAILTEHRQKMAMIAKGLLPQDLKTPSPPKRGDTGQSSLTTIAIGIAFLLAEVIGKLNSWILVPAFICICVGGTRLLVLFFSPSPLTRKVINAAQGFLLGGLLSQLPNPERRLSPTVTG
ncbi:MAG: hypothetical protein ABDK94_01580 [Atribacterota bacterium]